MTASIQGWAAWFSRKREEATVENYKPENWVEKVLESKKPVLVDSLLPWAAPIEVQAKELEKLFQEWDGVLQVGFLNGSRWLEIFGEGRIGELPNLALFHHGQPEISFSGNRRFQQMAEYLSAKFARKGG